MEVRDLQEKVCKGVDATNDENALRSIEKVLAPFLRTLKKRKHEKADVLPTDYEELYLKKNTKELLLRLESGFTDSLKLNTLMNETAELLKVVTKSKGVNLYLTDYDCGEIVLCPRYYRNNPRFCRKYTIGTYMAPHVAFTKEYVISSDILGDIRFPQGIPDVAVVKSAICLPIITNVEGNCIGVIELYRECSDRPYDLINLQICNALTAWMGIAIEQNTAKLGLIKEIEIQRQLSSLADLYFCGVAPFNKIVSDFVKVTKAAVNAERGAFYMFHEPLRPNTDDTILADAYEEGTDENNDTVLYKKRDRVRFVKNRPGIPGYAARTGEVVSIQDAYKDYRFDKKTDSPFYKTRSVVAFPIKNENGVMGVLNLVNNLKYPHFREEDIALIQSFSCYFTLICGYFLLETFYFKTLAGVELRLVYTLSSPWTIIHPATMKAHSISLQQLRLLSTDKLLDFHTRPSSEEINAFKTVLQGDQSFPTGFFRFEWETTGYEEEACKYIGNVFLYAEILEPTFDVQNLADFLLRVRKSYRPVFYHNFDHALNVFHFVFNIIVRNKDTYNDVEVTSLLLACLCHDIDHSGFTNSFLTLKNDYIYKLYGDFCGEAHRYEFTLFLIQQTDLLSNFSEENVKQVCKSLKRLMLAFDIAIHFQDRQKITKLLNSATFSWEDPEHRFLSQNIILICSDHSINFKSFEVVRKGTALWYKELHKQGDLEKSMGFSPLPMLDRNKSDVIPENQSIYLSMVVFPCVEILIQLFPNLMILEEILSETIRRWNEVVGLRGRDLWKINQALLKERRDRKPTHRVTLASTLSSLRTIMSETRSDRF